jgi:hypothetical protein
VPDDAGTGRRRRRTTVGDETKDFEIQKNLPYLCASDVNGTVRKRIWLTWTKHRRMTVCRVTQRSGRAGGSELCDKNKGNELKSIIMCI